MHYFAGRLCLYLIIVILSSSTIAHGLATNNNEQKSPSTDQAAANTEEEVSLTPEMEQANRIYLTAMNLNPQTNYKLLSEAATVGHIGAKEQLALGHLMGVQMPMDFARARKYFEEGVATGSPASHYGLYFMHSIGLMHNASVSKALVHLTLAAADGDNLARLALANRHWRAINVPQDCESALMFYQQVATEVVSKTNIGGGPTVQRLRLHDEEERPSQNNLMIDGDLLQYYHLLADRGDSQAQYSLGQLYYLHDRAIDKAFHYFRLAADSGNTNALAYLGKLYADRTNNVKENQQKALEIFQQTTEKGNAIGQASLGFAYYHGIGVEQSYEKAFKLFQLSADQEHAEGEVMLGLMYANGESVQRDLSMALKWFDTASRSGHVFAYYYLGLIHSSGMDVQRSCLSATEFFKHVAESGSWSLLFPKAFHLYRQGQTEAALMMYLYLAELGYEVAQSNAAYILDRMSDDVSNIYKSKDERYRKAYIYWHRAAEQDFHVAHLKLGDYYYYGRGMEPDYDQAAVHYQNAADRSQSPQAMFNLAYMYERGLGFKQDRHLAKRFYDMAVQTNPDAYLPVTLALVRLRLESFMETTSDLGYSWDLYFMAILLGVIGALLTARRQRATPH